MGEEVPLNVLGLITLHSFCKLGKLSRRRSKGRSEFTPLRLFGKVSSVGSCVRVTFYRWVSILISYDKRGMECWCSCPDDIYYLLMLTF